MLAVAPTPSAGCGALFWFLGVAGFVLPCSAVYHTGRIIVSVAWVCHDDVRFGFVTIRSALILAVVVCRADRSFGSWLFPGCYSAFSVSHPCGIRCFKEITEQCYRKRTAEASCVRKGLQHDTLQQMIARHQHKGAANTIGLWSRFSGVVKVRFGYG